MSKNAFKAIVVDDEQITRRGIIDYIQWDKLDVEVVGEASDGMEALDLVEKLQPDLMLCDIKMPRMDGIALAKKVNELLPACKIIFLSAYSDVHYLKSAIQLKAIDYVEKPINLNELTELIHRTILLCKEDREKEFRERELMVKIEQSIPYLRYKLLLSILEDESENDNGIKVAAELAGIKLPTQGKYACCVLHTPDKEMLEKILHKLTEALEAAKVLIASGELKQQLVFFCHIEGDIGLHRIISISREIIASVRSELRANAAIGISGVCDSIYRSREMFRQASEAAAHYFFMGINTVIQYSDIKLHSKQYTMVDKQILSIMEKFIMEQDFRSSLKLLDSVVDTMKNGDISSINHIKQELFRIYLIISKIFSDLVLQLENSVLWARIFATGDIFTIRNFIANSIMYIEQSIISTRFNKYNFSIREVETYIQKNYSNNISINDIAREVYLTPTYLCAVFKKEKGETINDYITKVRVQNAMWLLKDRKLKLYEISLKVGYDDPNYFAKVFKKITGYNPSEYRNTV